MAITIDCSEPKELLKQAACLACLSESELLKLEIILLNRYLSTLRGADYYTLPDDVRTLMQDSACYMCFSDKQLLQVLVLFTGYLAYGGAEGDISALSSQIRCILCGSSKQAKSAIAHLLCLISAALFAPQ